MFLKKAKNKQTKKKTKKKPTHTHKKRFLLLLKICQNRLTQQIHDEDIQQEKNSKKNINTINRIVLLVSKANKWNLSHLTTNLPFSTKENMYKIMATFADPINVGSFHFFSCKQTPSIWHNANTHTHMQNHNHQQYILCWCTVDAEIAVPSDETPGELAVLYLLVGQNILWYWRFRLHW